MADDASPHHYLIASQEQDNAPVFSHPEPYCHDVSSNETYHNRVQAGNALTPNNKPISASTASNGDSKPIHMMTANGFSYADSMENVLEIPLGGHILRNDPMEDQIDFPQHHPVHFNQPDRGHVFVVKYPRLRRARMETRRIVEHLAVRLIGVALVLFDIIIVIIDIVLNTESKGTMEALDAISIAVWCYFLVEISLRIFAKGKKFFRSKLDLLDLVIITVTGSVTIIYVSVDLAGSYFKLVVVFRILRIFLLARLLSERKHVSKATRKIVSQNKRRYMEDGFDLDLTYITDRVIASSFPSSGSRAMYRNPIEEVARFLDTKHADHYKVYNLCIERHYDESYFHNRVGRVLIYDHSVPKLGDLVKFCADVRQWMEADSHNIVFIHCKGGKGRTGLAICAWLLESGVFTTTAECINYFGSRRTDYTEGDMYQGVDTPSQSRYIDYYQKVKYHLNGQLPPATPLIINTVRITAMQGVGKGDGRDLCMEVYSSSGLIFACDFQHNKDYNVLYDFDSDAAVIQVRNRSIISGDVKIKFKSSNKKIPKAYEDCAFFFWFYTGFIEDNKLHLARKDLDNPHKAETWRVYRDKFAVDILFTSVQESDA